MRSPVLSCRNRLSCTAFSACLILLTLVLPAPASGQEIPADLTGERVRLLLESTGDRIIGTVLRQTENQLLLEVARGSEVLVERSDIRRFQVRVREEGRSPQRGAAGGAGVGALVGGLGLALVFAAIAPDDARGAVLAGGLLGAAGGAAVGLAMGSMIGASSEWQDLTEEQAWGGGGPQFGFGVGPTGALQLQMRWPVR